MSYKNPADKKRYNDEYRQRNLEKLRAYGRQRVRSADQVERHKAYRKAWAKKRADHVRRVNQEWYKRVKSDPEKAAVHCAVQDAWRQRNKEKISQIMANYRLRHLDKIKAKVRAYAKVYVTRRRARKLAAKGDFKRTQWQARYDFYGGRCAYCQCAVAFDAVHVDHVIALAKGGSNWPANLVPACASCNKRKGVSRWVPKLFSVYFGQIDSLESASARPTITES